ncbi:MAG: hypothetical protein JW910_17190, partial [Anaerolineae bacterium]|nr:hypothetical protein [Anaerolineae bacterium]
MINSIHLTLAQPSPDAPPLIPAFLLFSNAPDADRVLLARFAPQTIAQARGDRVKLLWRLPDPDVALGSLILTRTQATTYQAHNQAAAGVHLVMVRDAPGATDRHTLALPRFYVDWLGALGGQRVRKPAGQDVPVTGLSQRQARALREHGQFGAAAQVLSAELARLVTPQGGFERQAGCVLHEAAMLAEAMGKPDAWDYFDTVALIVYPNCHDALIGLALCAQSSPPQAYGLLGR